MYYKFAKVFEQTLHPLSRPSKAEAQTREGRNWNYFGKGKSPKPCMGLKVLN